MNRDETKKIIALIVNNYDRFQFDSNKIDMWTYSLQDLDYHTCEVATFKYIQTNKWPPTIADIRKSVMDITTNNAKTAGEAWEEVRKAVGKYGRSNAKKAMDSFDPVTRKAVSAISFVQICNSTNLNVQMGQFTKVYDQLMDRERELSMMSKNLVDQIERIRGSSFGLLEGEENGKEQKKICE